MKPQFRHFRWAVATTAFILATSWTNHGYANAPVGRYTISNGTVFDTQTKLTWQQTISDAFYTWDEAKKYCSNLNVNGLGGWRLPSVKELQTLVDRRRTDPAVDSIAFPNTPATYFWTSSPFAGSPPNAWPVNFSDGVTYPGAVTSGHHVRCVR